MDSSVVRSKAVAGGPGAASVGALLRVLASAVVVGSVLLAPTAVLRAGEAASTVSVPINGGELPAEGPGARDWRALYCGADCAVPRRLDLHGRSYTAARGAHRQVRRRDAATRTLRWTVRSGSRPVPGVLVGAEGSSSASDLVVRVGAAPEVSVPDGPLTLLQLPANEGPLEVTLVERGRAGATETLRIQEYSLSPP